MNIEYRGGNSRLLTRALEQRMLPTAILDSSGAIVYVNGRLCQLARLDSTHLVGKRCSWQLAQDRAPAAVLLNALAPPESALSGAITARQFTTPPFYGTDIDSQLFVPLVDDRGSVTLTLVILGRWTELREQLPEPANTERQRDVGAALVQLRSQNASLDGLHALLGESSQAQVAMSRAQLAVLSPLPVLLSGPDEVGKSAVAEGIYRARLANKNIRPMMGFFTTIDGQVAGFEQVSGQLESLQSRLKPDTPQIAHAVYLRRLDLLDDFAMSHLMHFVSAYGGRCTYFASVSEDGRKKREENNAEWTEAFARLSAIELPMLPLADRREDVPLLVHSMVSQLASEESSAPPRISADAMKLLLAYNWPGNLRELDETLRYAMLHAVGGGPISAQHLPLGVRAFPGTVHQIQESKVEPIQLDRVLEDVEREVIKRALAASPRNRAGAARLLGITRPRLLRRIEILGLGDPANSANSSEKAEKSREEEDKVDEENKVDEEAAKESPT